MTATTTATNGTTAPTAESTKIFVGDTSYDISTPLGALGYVKAMNALTPGLMNDDIAEMLKAQPILKWSDEKLADNIKERVKANAKAILKDATKIDHVKRFLDTATFIVGKTKKPHADIITTISMYVESLNVALTAYNAANEGANLIPYALIGGSPKEKRGGKGEGRSYRDLAALLIKHADLWQGKPQIIEYGARSLAYPVLIENGETVIQYTGATITAWIDTRDKDTTKDTASVGPLARDVKGNILGRVKHAINGVPFAENGKTYPIGKLNALNAWANGAALDDDGKAKPTAGPNSWITCTLDGLSIPDGVTKKMFTPTIAEFYDLYIGTLTADDNSADDSE